MVKGAIKFIGGILFGAGLVALFVTSKGFGFAIEGRTDVIAVGMVILGVLIMWKG
ncbi:hypothetical protein HYY73_03925 [Candidatus Woesearchaeota archaeon]|nr:hypothetical protein [Candidatus Woesearchaeota archaeon]